MNVAEGAYVVILNWQAEGSAVKGAGVGYVSNNGRAWIQVSGDRFQGFIVSRFHRFKVSSFQSFTPWEIALQRELIKEFGVKMPGWNVGAALGHGVLRLRSAAASLRSG